MADKSITIKSQIWNTVHKLYLLNIAPTFIPIQSSYMHKNVLT
jgi:hypothetical protein